MSGGQGEHYGERLRHTLEALHPQKPHGVCNRVAAGSSTTTTFYIVRHGESVYNAEGRFAGSVDTALNEMGLAQADEVAQVMAREWPCDAVVSSPLQRAMKTAEAIHASRRESGLGPVVALAGLAECNAGELQGELQTDVVAAVTACEAQWTAGNLDHPYPGEGGESPAQVSLRARSALREAAALGEHVIVGCHGMTLKCLAVHCLGCGWADLDDMPITNCCVSTFTLDHGTAGELSTRREKLFEKVITHPTLADVQAGGVAPPGSNEMEAKLKRLVRPVRGFPRPDATFADITPLLADGEAFKHVVDAFVDRYRGTGLAAIAAPEARGFFFGPAVAAALGVGFIPVRKPEQLPGPTYRSQVVSMDYGERQMEVHAALLPSGYYTTSNKVVLIDDILATGGSLLACIEVLEKLGLRVIEGAVVYDLNIGGEAALAAVPHYGGVPVFKLADFQAAKGRWFLERGTEQEAASTISPHMGKTLKTGTRA